MKTSERFSIIIAIASCPLAITFVTSTWELGIKAMCTILLYIFLFIVYIAIPWRYKRWLCPKALDPDDQAHAQNTMTIIKLTHYSFFGFFVLIQIIACGAVLTRAYFPTVVDEVITSSLPDKGFHSLPVKPRLLAKDVVPSAPPEGTFVLGANHANEMTMYPVSKLSNYLIPSILKPVWDFILSLSVIFFGMIIFMWLFEFMVHDRYDCSPKA